MQIRQNWNEVVHYVVVFHLTCFHWSLSLSKLLYHLVQFALFLSLLNSLFTVKYRVFAHRWKQEVRFLKGNSLHAGPYIFTSAVYRLSHKGIKGVYYGQVSIAGVSSGRRAVGFFSWSSWIGVQRQQGGLICIWCFLSHLGNICKAELKRVLVVGLHAQVSGSWLTKFERRRLGRWTFFCVDHGYCVRLNALGHSLIKLDAVFAMSVLFHFFIFIFYCM